MLDTPSVGNYASQYLTYDAVDTNTDAANGITIEYSNFLFTADFSRDGINLIMSGSEGRVVVIENYFLSQATPDIYSPEGAVLRGSVVETLAGPLAPGVYAQQGQVVGQDPIGQVESVSGGASVQRADGTVEPLQVGVKVFQNDVVQTQDGGALSITFVDGTIFSLSASSRMVLDKLVYAPQGDDNSAIFSLVEGSFVFIAGQLAGTGDMQVNTPVATMGIRGTTVKVDIQVTNGVSSVIVSLNTDPDGGIGAIVLTDLNGNLLADITQTDTSWLVVPGADVAQEIPRTATDLATDQFIIDQAVAAFQSSQNRIDAGGTFVEGAVSANIPTDAQDGDVNENDDESDDSENTQEGQSEQDSDDQDGSEGQENQDGQPADSDENLQEEGNLGGSGLGEPEAPAETILTSIEGDAISGANQTTTPLITPTSEGNSSNSQGSGLENNSSNDNTDDEEIIVVEANVNTAPSISLPNLTTNVVEDEAITIDGFNLVDAQNDPLVVDILAGSSFMLTPGSGVTILSSEPDLLNQGFFEAAVLTGTADQLNAALNGLIYRPSPDDDDGGFLRIEVSDGDLTSVSTLQVGITPVNDAPDAVGDTLTRTENDSQFFGDLILNDIDPDTGDALTVVQITDIDNATSGIIVPIGQAYQLVGGGTITFQANGQYTLQNGTAYDGLSSGETIQHTLSYVVSDNDGETDTATLTITVTGTNDGPVISGDLSTDVNEAGTVTLSTEDINGIDPDDVDADLIYTVTSAPANGELQLATINGIEAITSFTQADLAAGRVQFTHDGSQGARSTNFTVSLSDGGEDGALAVSSTINININVINDAPEIIGDLSVSGGEGGTITITTNDIDGFDPDDSGEGLVFTITSAPSNGQILVNGIAATSFTQTDLIEGLVAFEHDGSETNLDSFVVSLADGGEDGANADAATFNITINNVNDAPINTVPASITGNEDSQFSISGVSVFDSDSTELTVTLSVDSGVLNIATGLVSGVAASNITNNGSSSVTLIGTASQLNTTFSNFEGITYTSDANFNGSDALTVTTSDGELTDIDTVPITINSVNDAPETQPVSVSANEDAPSIVIELSGSDVDGNVASFRIASEPENGTLFLDASLATKLDVNDTVNAVNNSASVFFVPENNFTGEISFDFAAIDNDGAEDPTPAIATINVAEDNDTPVTSDATAIGDEDATSIEVVLSGSDVDGSVASFRIVSFPENGTLFSDASLMNAIEVGDEIPAALNSASVFFSPNANFNGTVTFEFAAVDNQGFQDATPATASITVNAVNDAPIAQAATNSGDEDNTITGQLLATDVDNAISDLSFAIDGGITDGPSNGAVVVNADGSYVYTPNANFNGTDAFSYQVSDGNGGVDIATITLNVNSINDAPDGFDDESGHGDLVERGDGDANENVGTITGSPFTLRFDDVDTDGTAPTFSIAADSENAAIFDLIDFNFSYSPGSPVGSRDTVDVTGSISASALDGLSEDEILTGTFDLIITDSDGGVSVSDASTSFTIDLVGNNDVPTLEVGSITAQETTVIVPSFDLTTIGNDVEDGTALTYSTPFIDSEFFSNGISITGTDLSFNPTGEFENLAEGEVFTADITLRATDSDGAFVDNTFTFNVVGENDAPTLDLDANDSSGATGANYNATFTEGAGAVNIGDLAQSDIAISDVDDTNIESATITLTNIIDGTDEFLVADIGAINATNPNIVVSAYDPNTGTITLTGLATLSEYEGALENIRYNNINNTPDTTDRIINVVVNDGDTDSNVAVATISVVPVNDVPIIETSNVTTAYTENAAPVVINETIVISDLDSANITSATVSIASNFETAGDVLGFVNTSTITGQYDTNTGVLTLSGLDTLENYQTALRSVTFENTTDSPSDLLRTIEFQVDDGTDVSNVATSVINPTSVNDGPTVSAVSASGDEDQAIALTDIVINDVDAGDANVSLSLTATNGIINVNQNIEGGLTSDSFIGGSNGTAQVVISASIEEIRETLGGENGILFIPDANFNGTTQVDISINDLGNSGSGVAQNAMQTIDVVVNSVDDAAEISVTNPDAFNATEQGIVNEVTVDLQEFFIANDVDGTTPFIDVDSIMIVTDLSIDQPNGLQSAFNINGTEITFDTGLFQFLTGEQMSVFDVNFNVISGEEISPQTVTIQVNANSMLDDTNIINGSTSADGDIFGTNADDIIFGNGIDSTQFQSESLFGGTGNDILVGSDEGSERFDGGDGNDTIITGNSDPNSGDVTFGSFGNDRINFAGNTNGYQSISYSNLNASLIAIVATIDFATNTGTIDKLDTASMLTGLIGTDTLVDVSNPILSIDGGLSIRGTQQDDIYNITSSQDGFIALVGGSGNDIFNLESGLIRLEFRVEGDGLNAFAFGANQGANVNLGLANNQVINDGFGFTDDINFTGDFSSGSGNSVELRGTDFDDILIGGAGDDRFIGERGNDFIDGGAGIDLIRLDRSGAASVSIDLEAGTGTGFFDDTVFNYTLSNIEDIRGSNVGVDVLQGDGGNNRIEGRRGIDFINGRGGDDILIGDSPSGTPDDRDVFIFDPFAGNDTIEGFTIGQDRIAIVDSSLSGVGTGGFDSFTFDGTDTIIQFDGGASVITVVGVDLVNVADPEVSFIFNGISAVTGVGVAAGADIIEGTAESDIIEGTSGDDVINGGDGDDIIIGGGATDGTSSGAFFQDGEVLGGDQIDGGAGDDLIIVESGSSTVVGGAGDDRIQSSRTTFISDEISFADFLQVDYSSAATGIIANLTSEARNGLGSQQVSDGLGGIDTLGGVTRVRDSQFDDVFFVDSSDPNSVDRAPGVSLTGGDDMVTFFGSGNGGRIIDFASASEGVNISLSTQTATDVDLTNGNQLGNNTIVGANRVNGSAFNDVIIGDGNDNRLRGRDGDDILNGGNGGFNTIDHFTSINRVVVDLSQGLTLDDGQGGVDTLINIQGAFGNFGTDTLIGDDVNNDLLGFGGSDVLIGGGGDDFLLGDNGNVARGNGVLTSGGDDLLVGGAGNDNLAGGIGADLFVISSDNNDGVDNDDGFDFIQDFNFSEGDRIGLINSDITFINMNSVSFNTEFNNTFVSLGEFTGVFFNNVNLTTLSQEELDANFIFNIIENDNGQNNITGTSGDDYILINPTGFTDPNNAFTFISATSGSDTYDFTAGYDDFQILNYGNLGGEINATINGIDNLGVVQKADGDIDTLRNISTPLTAGGLTPTGGFDIRGTSFDDTFNITALSNTFISIRGAAGDDTFNIDNTDGGFVRLDLRGGFSGVNVDLSLASGQIIDDGTGGTDTVNFNGDGTELQIRGTDFADTIIGSSGNESFISEQSGDGVDIFNGGGGFDRIRFDRAGAVSADVDLEQQTATGFWDNTIFQQTLIDIDLVDGSNEGVDILRGTEAGDETLEGNGSVDILNGRGGNDTLTGGLDVDGFIYGLGSGQDKITDFAIGEDRIIITDFDFTNTDDFNSFTFDGSNTIIEFDSNSIDILTVEGVDLTSLASPNTAFVFNNVIADPTNGDFNGTSEADLILGTSGDDVIFGGAGDDVIATQGSSSGYFSNGGFVDGGAGDDLITVDGGFSTIIGGAGNDRIQGSQIVYVSDEVSFSDFFTVDYSTSTSGITVNYTGGVQAGLQSQQVNDGLGGIDTLGGITNIQDTAFDDIFFVDGSDQTNRGGTGPRIYLTAGNDTVTFLGNGGRIDYIEADDAVDASLSRGNAFDLNLIDPGTDNIGTDTFTGATQLLGSNFDDILTGDENNNSFRGREGDDLIDGQGGVNRADYFNTTNRIVVDLNLTTGQVIEDGEGGVDTLINIQNISGNFGADTIIGDDNSNELSGFSGSDVLIGNGGDDRLNGDFGNVSLAADGIAFGGNDFLAGGLGQDVLYGGIGADVFAISDLSGPFSENFDFILDFDANEGDRIDISEFANFTSVSEFGGIFFDAGNFRTDIDLDNDGLSDFTLENFNLTNFSQSEQDGFFIFDVISGTLGDDIISGTGGDDYIRPVVTTTDGQLLSGQGQDKILASGGNDTIDLSFSTGSEVAFDYSGIENAITVALDTFTDIATVDKGGQGTDTLRNYSEASKGGGLEIIGTDNNDSFNIGSSAGFTNPLANDAIPNIDGGLGQDILGISGSNQVLDFSELDVISGIEEIDLGGGGNTVTLDSSNVIEFSDQVNEEIAGLLSSSNGDDAILVTGGAADILNLSNASLDTTAPSWQLDATDSAEVSGFDVYNFTDGANTFAQVVVEEEVVVNVVA